MRSTVAWVVMVVSVLSMLAFACGPSARDVALAKLARYRGSKLGMFARAKWAVARRQRIAISDETTLTIVTKGRWLTPEGLATPRRPGDLRMPDKSLYVAMTVRFLPEGEYLIVDVQPTIARFNIGMPVLEPIDPTQIDVPGWLTGKVDLVAWEIHQVLLPYLVKGVTGSTPEPPPYVPADAGPEPDYVPLVPHTIEL